MKILTSYLLNLIDTNKIEDYVKALNYYDKVKEFYEVDELEFYNEGLDKKGIYVDYDEDNQVIILSDAYEEIYGIEIDMKCSVITLKLSGKEYLYAVKEKTYLHDFVRVLLKDLHLIL